MVVSHPVEHTQNVQYSNDPHPPADRPSWPSTCTMFSLWLGRLGGYKLKNNILTNDGVRFGHLMRFPVCPRFSHMISSAVRDKATALMVIWERWDLRHHDSEKLFLCSPLDGQRLPRCFTRWNVEIIKSVAKKQHPCMAPLAHGQLGQLSSADTHTEPDYDKKTVLYLTSRVMDQIYVKTQNPKCRLYWCLIEFIGRRYNQSCWYFRPLLWASAHLTFSLVVLPPSSPLPCVNKKCTG